MTDEAHEPRLIATTSLEEYSEAVREVLIKRLPSLPKGWPRQPDGSYLLEVESPSGSKLLIGTFGRQITVGFGDFHHWHFGTNWEAESEPEWDVSEAASFIEELMNGRRIIAEWNRKGKFVLSESHPAVIDPKTVERSWLGRWWLRGCELEVKGWDRISR